VPISVQLERAPPRNFSGCSGFQARRCAGQGDVFGCAMRELYPLSDLQAASRLEISRDFRCGANFFLALKTRHWTVPMGMFFAAAIS
jgi:hypothetical protein